MLMHDIVDYLTIAFESHSIEGFRI